MTQTEARVDARTLLTALFCFSVSAACADTEELKVTDGPASPPTEAGGDLGASGDVFPSGPVNLSGTVLAPNGKMPISGALIYVTVKEPKPIPDKVFCDKCVELPKSTPHARSNPDGTFKLKVPYKGKWILVVQKGAFRRARWIIVSDKDATLSKGLTTLPSKTDKAKGDFIPKMAVIRGAWDAIENSLAKLGLGKTDAKGNVVAGSESFSIYDCKLTRLWPPKLDCKPKHPSTLLTSYDELSKYQILFVPCDSDWLDGYFYDKKVKENVRKWVKAGGRLYVTDYQYDLLQQVFPGYITWKGQSSTMGSAELAGSYDAPAVVKHADLTAWLKAQGITSFKLEDSYTIVSKLSKLPTPGPDEKSHDVLPQAWIYGDVPSNGVLPATVSYPYGCGRILFSTYHTEGKKSTGSTLLPQERALLYVILEMAVCLKNPLVK